MLKKIQEPLANYSKNGSTKEQGAQNSPSAPTPKKRMPKVSLRSTLTVIGLSLFFVVAMAAVMIAQRQQDIEEPVAPNAPVSQPQAASSVGPEALPWTSGGPTSGWTDAVNKLVSVCNRQYCWIYNYQTGVWNNNGIAINISQQNGWAPTKAAPDGTRPWTNGGPTSGWTDTQTNTSSICNGKWCWIYSVANGWQRNGDPIDISSAWASQVQAGSDGTLPWTNGGPKSGWTDDVNKAVSVCNGKWCWVYNFGNGTWANNGSPIDISTHSGWSAVRPASDGTRPWSNGGPTAGWTDTNSHNASVCNGKWCWIYKMNVGWQNNGNPIDISTTTGWQSVKPSNYTPPQTGACTMTFVASEPPQQSTPTPPPSTPTPPPNTPTPPPNTPTPPPNTPTPPPSGVVSCTWKKAFLVAEDGTTTEITSGSKVPRGSEVQYRVRLTATSTTPGEVVVTDQLSSNVEWIGTSQSNRVSHSNGTVTITVPQFTNTAQTYAYNVRVTDASQPVTISNTARVTDKGDGTAGNSCSTSFATPPVGAAVCESKIAYTVDANGTEVPLADQAAVDPGDEFFYKVTVTADSTTNGDVEVTDTLPSSLEYVSAVSPSNLSHSNGTITASLGTMGQASNQTKTVVYKVRVADAASPGTLTNAAEVTTAGGSASTCSISVVLPPDGVAACVSKEMHTDALSSGKPASETLISAGSTVHAGREFYYRVKLEADAQTAGDVNVTDTLPDYLELVSAGDFTNNAGVLSSALSAFSGTKTLEFKVRVKNDAGAGTISNVASVATEDRSGSTISGSNVSCSTNLTVPAYSCNSTCTTDEQCQQVNSNYICDADSGNRCRLDSNRSSESCQPVPQTYACNSSCTSDSQCQTVNANYVCAATSDGNRCRLNSNTTASNCLPTNYTPPPPSTGCNAVCTTNADCSNPSHICYQTSDGTNRCRLDSYVNSTTCSQPPVTVQTTDTTQPVLPDELPQTGPEEWVTWLKAGLVTLGIGAALLLLL